MDAKTMKVTELLSNLYPTFKFYINEEMDRVEVWKDEKFFDYVTTEVDSDVVENVRDNVVKFECSNAFTYPYRWEMDTLEIAAIPIYSCYSWDRQLTELYFNSPHYTIYFATPAHTVMTNYTCNPEWNLDNGCVPPTASHFVVYRVKE